MAIALCPVLVGREEELAQLDRLLDAALVGSGRLVLITGEAGIGKSRLGRELGARARAGGAATVTGRALPSGTVRPYLPLSEALRQVLRDRPLPADPDFARWRSILGAIVPEVIGGRAPDASPSTRGEAVVQLLRRISDPDGLLVVLEDAHWADPDTLAVVEYLANNLAGARTLCVATCRDEPAREQITRLLDSRAASRLALTRLDDEATARMARACLPAADEPAIERVLRVADGVPFLVEEVLASPGVPASFAESVGARLAAVDDEVRAVLSVAAILGRTFDWRLLAAASGQSEQVVDRALELGVHEQLLRLEAGVFSFRHALSREAILERMLPSRRRAVARAALAALDAAHPQPEAGWRDLAAELATEAGDTARAGALLAESGRAALERGALATAIDALRRAHACAEPAAASPLVRALALAGRVEEAVAIGADTAARTQQPAARAAVHLELAHAAVAATRWPLARSQLAQARRLLTAEPDGGAQARVMVLEAEVALAADDLEGARRLAATVVSGGDGPAEIRCQAWEILGRIERFTDRDAARERFEQALTTAQSAALPFWQLRAMHELGTIDMFDHAGVDRLLQARRTAEQLGALSTAAVLDLQLVAAYHCRFELAAARRHGRSALALAEQLRLEQARPKALLMLAENAAWRGERHEMDCYAGRTRAASDDATVGAFLWGGRGMYELLHGESARAVAALGRAAAVLADLPHAEPALFRAMWPVLLASVADRRAPAAVAEARRLGIDSFHLNAGVLRGAAAILAGRSGDASTARRWVDESASDFANCMAWHDAVRLLAAESAAAHGWDDPGWWASGLAQRLTRRGLTRLAARARALAGSAQRWAGLGVTPREADVLSLLVDGLANKQIAARLRLSPRTVEKHVESLLRKLDARSRAQLAVVAQRRATT